MRKGLIALIALVVILLLSVFILIPKELIISDVTTIKSSQYSIWRYLSIQDNWTKWWPAESKPKAPASENQFYNYNRYSFKITKLLYNALEVEVKNKDLVTNGKIVMIPLTSDSILIQWQNALQSDNNPFNKIKQYAEGKNIKRTMTLLLKSLKAFNEDKVRVYKFNIHHTTLKDTCLVATKTITKSYPSVQTVYNMINHLKKYISNQGAKETNYPMLNITETDSNHYTTMVAIATDKKLEGNGDITFKRMIIYKDRVLAADVKGGPETIREAYEEIRTYMSDYKLDVPVIHFEYLETDRSKERDTSKWITRIYFPII